MPSLYDAIAVRGTMRYRLNKQFIAADKVPDHVKEAITLDNFVDENGIVVVDQKVEEAKQLTLEEQEELDKKEPESPEDQPTESQEGATPDGQTDDNTPESSESTTSTPPPAPEVGAEILDEGADTPADVAPQKAISERKKSTPRQEPKFISKVPQSHPGMGFPRVNGKTVDIFDGITPHTKIKLIGGHAVPLSEESFKSRTEAEIEKRLRELGFTIVNLNNMEAAMAQNLESEAGSDDDGLSDDSARE